MERRARAPVYADGVMSAARPRTPARDWSSSICPSVIKRPLVDGSGDRLGKVQDLIVRAGEAPHPPGGRRWWSTSAAATCSSPSARWPPSSRAGCCSTGRRVDLRRFERRPGELCSARDLLAHHLINFVGGRLIRANEIELAKVNGAWEVVAVDPSSRAVLRRLLPGAARRRIPGAIVDWASIEPFVAHVPTSRCASPTASWPSCTRPRSPTWSRRPPTTRARRSSRRSGPTASWRPMCSRSSTPSTSSSSCAPIRRRSRPAAGLDGPGRRRRPDHRGGPGAAPSRSSSCCPSRSSARSRSLFSYNPETAGGLMSPDFLSRSPGQPVDQVLDADPGQHVRRQRRSTSSSPSTTQGTWWGRPAVRLVQADPERRLRDHRRGRPGPRAPRLGPRCHGPQDVRLQPDRGAGAWTPSTARSSAWSPSTTSSSCSSRPGGAATSA